jgi:hypothetical protein
MLAVRAGTRRTDLGVEDDAAALVDPEIARGERAVLLQQQAVREADQPVCGCHRGRRERGRVGLAESVGGGGRVRCNLVRALDMREARDPGRATHAAVCCARPRRRREKVSEWPRTSGLPGSKGSCFFHYGLIRRSVGRERARCGGRQAPCAPRPVALGCLMGAYCRPRHPHLVSSTPRRS